MSDVENCFIKSLSIRNFRNIEEKDLVFNKTHILITGKNGSGKTSILEAISLLSQGKGLRGEKFSQLVTNTKEIFNLTFDINSYIGNIILEQNVNNNSSKREILLNSKNIPSSELSKLSNVFWLIPQQNTLFQGPKQNRRKFYDRIVFSFFPGFATEINKYEHYQQERMKILTSNFQDKTWLDILEDKLTNLAMEITRKRLNILDKLNNHIMGMDTKFPKIHLQLQGELEETFLSPDNNSNIREKYLANRAIDAKSHKSHFGILRTDFRAIFSSKNIDAEFCSTGEQQSCLITLLIGHTDLFIKKEKKNPILLLDELFAHLDEKNKSYLSDFIFTKKLQTFVTTTESSLCSEYRDYSEIISL